MTKLQKAQYRIAGQLIEKRWIIRTSLRLCPCCIAETAKPDDDGFVGQATWHIPFMRQCPKHNVLLKSFGRVGYTGSVHDFTKRCFEHRWDILCAADDATVCDPSALSRYIEARSMGAPVKHWIDTLELNAAAYFCELLGLLVECGADVGVSALTDIERAHVGDTGYSIAVGGPADVKVALWALPRPLVKSKAQAHLGSLYQWLSRSAKGPQYDLIKDLVREYIVESFPIGPGETVLGQVVQQRRVYSLTTFTQYSRASMKRSRKALIAASLINPNAGRPKVQTSEVFCAEAARPVLDKLNGGVTRRLALKLLNIPRAQFDALASGEVLRPMPGLGEITPYYARSEVFRLRDQLGQVKGGGCYPDDMVDIQTACRKLVCGAAEIVQLIVDGRLEWIGAAPDKEGYAAVRVSVAELGGKLEGVGVEGYTKAKVKQILSVNDPAVKF
ncbi:TniQ family protein [uncultured Roseobacter sp.]|uniref:TniQ family protein n=1 Tax=uncultured Roseobacter sp. TaxID=114847 RepID=UPI002618A330|nr:TniQ family protein [uncultured Roseobacter sp.]